MIFVTVRGKISEKLFIARDIFNLGFPEKI